MRLGVKQLETLRAVGTTGAMVVPCPVTRRLCDLGLMKAHGKDGSFAAITPSGLRALADAAENGRLTLFVMPDRRATKGGGE